MAAITAAWALAGPRPRPGAAEVPGHLAAAPGGVSHARDRIDAEAGRGDRWEAGFLQEQPGGHVPRVRQDEGPLAVMQGGEFLLHRHDRSISTETGIRRLGRGS